MQKCFEYLQQKYPHLIAKLDHLTEYGTVLALYGGSEGAYHFATSSISAIDATIAHCQELQCMATSWVLSANTQDPAVVTDKQSVQNNLLSMEQRWADVIAFLREEIRPIVTAFYGVEEQSSVIDEEELDTQIMQEVSSAFAYAGSPNEEVH